MHRKLLLLLLIACLPYSPLLADDEESDGKRVMLTRDLFSLTVTHKGEKIEIRRNQDRTNQITEFYRGTWRGRIQPMNPFSPHAVETIGELEMLDYIRRLDAGEQDILIIDSRMPGSTQRGMIPLAVNIPYRDLKEEKMASIMQEQFGVTPGEPVWNFRDAKTLVMYCNGPWCGQSPTAIKRLLRAGYPASLIKYYRGGMQSWEGFGLTVVEP
ncbi:MAG: rhodanese-like domain-containing protein [Sedimenticolaceae bacterium]|nr:rhodanese-like domain-containing protein [Sedimenticolaceae bacterium]